MTALPLTMNAIAARQELAIHTAHLALRAVDSIEDQVALAYQAGKQAFHADMTMDDLREECPMLSLSCSSAAYSASCDGWHDACEAHARA